MARASAELLASKGGRIAIMDLPSSASAEVAAGMGATGHPCDVTDAATGAALGDVVVAHGALYVAVSTAGGGVGARTPSKECSPGSGRQAIDGGRTTHQILITRVVGAWAAIGSQISVRI